MRWLFLWSFSLLHILLPFPCVGQWRIIVGATKCIPKTELPEETEENSVTSNRLWTHPSDLTIALSASTPLYPPGRIIHVVHNHPAEQCWWVCAELWSQPMNGGVEKLRLEKTSQESNPSMKEVTFFHCLMVTVIVSMLWGQKDTRVAVC